MKKIENYEIVQASSGEFARPTAGGYICKIIDVEDVPMDSKEKGKGDYLVIEYDIADGDFKGYFKAQFDKWGGNWNASFIRSYKETALGMLKHFTNCIEASNAGYEWDFNEKGLIGKVVGLVLGEKEYRNKAGELKTKLVVSQIKTVEEIKKGDFKIPAIIKFEEETTTETPENTFTGFGNSALDDDLPF
jgi:hypothetical protein